ncbi:MAG: lamin tail domain-containing protein [Bacteroidota bacterium]
MRLFFWLWGLPLLLQAQFQDAFSDTTLLEQWQGQREKFVINAAQELQLKDENNNSPAYLYSTVPTADSTLWEFYFRQDFSPSSANFAQIILAANDTAWLDTNWSGYFLKLGGVSGTDDALELYKRTDGQDTLLIQGALGEAQVGRVRVLRDDNKLWTLWIDYDGGEDYEWQGTALDTTPLSGAFFGLLCKYTTTRSAHFFFDDFLVHPIFEDNISPSIVAMKIVDDQHLQLTYSEAILPESGGLLTSYTITPTIDLTGAEVHGKEVQIHLKTPLLPEQNYTLTIQNISDFSGNQMRDTSLLLRYVPPVQAALRDILINEIFADPFPSIALPGTEYVELFNRSDKTFQLEGFMIADARRELTLPAYELHPKEYVLLHVEEEGFSETSNALALPTFLSLVNVGDEVRLLDPEGGLIDAVYYERAWYKDAKKANGGWSLERTDTNKICSSNSEQWQASVNLNGGTPGARNSILHEDEDQTFAGATNAYFVTNDHRLRLVFREVLEERSATNIASYEADDVEILDAQLELPFRNSVLLKLDKAAIQGDTYLLQLQTNLADCLGNELEAATSVRFAQPEADSIRAALRINEILFNPREEGADFVEIYNASERAILLNGMFLANDNNGNLENIVPMEFSEPIVLFPNSYKVLTANPFDLLARYYVPFPDNLIRFALPPLPDDKGNVVLYWLSNDGTARLADAVNYASHWHAPAVDIQDGVSLERIAPNLSSQLSSTWHSAASTVGYATPTYKNSQAFESNLLTADEQVAFELVESTISPNGDGYQDFLPIKYDINSVGNLATARIFDAEGRLVRYLLNNELLATSGLLQWNGTDDTGALCSVGIYIIHIEYFDSSGTVRHFQANFALVPSR